jgi:hypothetical protein
MLHFLTTANNREPIRRYLRWWGGRLRGRVRLISYETIDDPGQLREGTYVFGDIERLGPEGLAKAEAICAALAARGGGFRLLNRPGHVLRRYDLLRLLHTKGLNDFNIYRIDEDRNAIRYPVFVRNVREHNGALSPLLHDAKAVDEAIATLLAAGMDPADVLVVEFLDTRGPDGYRKYSVMKAGGRLVAAHIFFDKGWMVKGTTEWPPERVAADNAFMAENPHVAAVGAVFDLAHIDFGRIDYALLDGRIQVWEINTVPTIQLRPRHYGADRRPAKEAFAQRFNAALAGLDPDRRWVPLGERLRSYHDIFVRPKEPRGDEHHPNDVTKGGKASG